MLQEGWRIRHVALRKPNRNVHLAISPWKNSHRDHWVWLQHAAATDTKQNTKGSKVQSYPWSSQHNPLYPKHLSESNQVTTRMDTSST